MAKIINLDEHRGKAEAKLSPDEMRAEMQMQVAILADGLLERWVSAVEMDELNEYIAYELGLHIKDYVSDLNALSEIEQDMNLTLAIFHPGMSPMSNGGFIAAVRIADTMISTPIMMNENYARAFAILFYNEMLNEGLVQESPDYGY